MPSPLRRFLAGLLPILLIALGVRYLGHRAGLPYPWHPDEPILMNEAVEMLQEDRLDPKFYHYPSLPFYLHMLGTSVWYLRQAKSPDMVRLDALRTEADTGIFRTISHSDLWAHERMVTALIGVLAVALTGLAARRLKDDRAGWIAALLLALSPHHVALSRYVTVDVPTSAGVAAVLLASAFLLREGAARHYALAGIALGASITCKYTVVVGAVVPLAALLLQRRPRLWWSLALWIFAGIAMVVCQPWFLLKPSDVLTDMATEVNRYANLELGGRFEPAGRLDYLLQCARLLAAESFPGGLLLALLSPLLLLRPHDPAPSALRRDRDALILAAAMPVTFLLFISGNKVFYDRNLTTVEPGLAVLAALGAGWLLVLDNTRAEGVPVHLDVIRLARSLLMYESMALRLHGQLQPLKQFRRYQKRADRRVARRFRRAGDGLGPREFRNALTARIEEGRQLIDRAAFYVEAILQNLPITRIAIPRKAAYVAIVLLQHGAIAGAGIALSLAVALIQTRAAAEAPLTLLSALPDAAPEAMLQPWLLILLALLAVSALRRVLFRLSDAEGG